MKKINIKIVCRDRSGLVGEISRAISRSGYSVTSHRAVCTDDPENGAISTFVASLSGGENDASFLASQLKRIRGIKSVEFVPY